MEGKRRRGIVYVEAKVSIRTVFYVLLRSSLLRSVIYISRDPVNHIIQFKFQNVSGNYELTHIYMKLDDILGSVLTIEHNEK